MPQVAEGSMIMGDFHRGPTHLLVTWKDINMNVIILLKIRIRQVSPVYFPSKSFFLLSYIINCFLSLP